MRTLFVPVLILVSALTLLSGCGGSNNPFDDGEFEVTDVDTIANDIEVGEAVRTEVFFTTEEEAFEGPEDVDVVVALPDSLRYVPDSSSIYDNVTDELDRREPDMIERCPDGSSFLVYFFDDDELDNRELISGGWGIRFEVEGTRPTPSAKIGAAADDSQFFACGESFADEASAVISVSGFALAE